MSDLHRTIKIGILTVSDTCYNGKAEDKSGENLKGLIESGKWFQGIVITKDIIHDVQDDIKAKLLHWCDNLKLEVILTTGGTGFSPRDVTPEATKAVIEKEAMGMTIAMMKGSLDITPLAMLSRLICGIRGNTLIINLPGSKKGSAECLQIVAESIPHAVDLLQSEKSNVELTHANLQAESIKSVLSSSSLHSLDLNSAYKKMKSNISSSPNLLKHLQYNEKEQSGKESVDQYCSKLSDSLEQLSKEATQLNYILIECHKQDKFDRSNDIIDMMTKFVQLLLVSIQNFTCSLEMSDQFKPPSLLPNVNKTIELEMGSWKEGCLHKQYDQTLITPHHMPAESKFTMSGSRCNKDLNSTKYYKSQAGNSHIESLCPSLPACPQIESHISNSSSYLSRSKQLEMDTSCKTEFYNNNSDAITLNSRGIFVPNSHKIFHQSCVENSRTSDYLRRTKQSGDEAKDFKISTYSSLPNPILRRDSNFIHNCTRKPVQIDLMSEKFQEDSMGWFRQNVSSLESEREDNMPVSMCKTPRMSDRSKEFVKVMKPTKHHSHDYTRWGRKQVIDKLGNLSGKSQSQSLIDCKKNQDATEKEAVHKNYHDDSMSYIHSPIITVENYSAEAMRSSSPNSSDQVPLATIISPDKNSPKALTAKSQATAENKSDLRCNIMSAKIHNMNNQGELVNVPVGKAFNCFVNDHRLLKGITLYKGKREIKKLFVYLSRQEDVTCQATSWKRGKEVLERNRLDDYFQLTLEGMEEQKQVHDGKKRDQYVVNWYMWCPGHGKCKRKCGGYGKCIENCKGMLHKQDRHNCNLMVNLKLFLSDLSTWRVHITGNHIPEQSSTTATTTYAVTKPLQENQPSSDMIDKPGSSTDNEFVIPDQCVDNKHFSRILPVVTSMEMKSSLTNVKCNENMNTTSSFFEKDYDLQQSKIPSKKRISKMLSSLKRRRQNKPYAFLKSRHINPNSSFDTGNDTTLSLPKKYNVNFDFSNDTRGNEDNTAFSGMMLGRDQTTASFNQCSLLSEFSSYLPENCSNDIVQGKETILTAESALNLSNSKSESEMTNSTPNTAALPLTCNISTVTKYSLTDIGDCITPHFDIAENIATTDMPQDDGVDIYQSAISLPNFHQSFLPANSLSEILTEAGVNMSEQFEDLNSSINLGHDSPCLTEINQSADTINKSNLPFHSSQQQNVLLPSSTLLGNESSNMMLPDSHVTNLHIDSTCKTSLVIPADGLPTYKEATLALAQQKRLTDRTDGSFLFD